MAPNKGFMLWYGKLKRCKSGMNTDGDDLSTAEYNDEIKRQKKQKDGRTKRQYLPGYVTVPK